MRTGSLASMARRANDLNWGIQREKHNADSGVNDATAAQMGYSDRSYKKIAINCSRRGTGAFQCFCKPGCPEAGYGR